VKKVKVLLIVSLLMMGCASTQSLNTQNCISVANKAENNEAKSGDDLYNECLDKKYQKMESKKGFWENSAEGLLFFVIDMVTS